MGWIRLVKAGIGHELGKEGSGTRGGLQCRAGLLNPVPGWQGVGTVWPVQINGFLSQVKITSTNVP
jgi:hypothetical protein